MEELRHETPKVALSIFISARSNLESDIRAEAAADRIIVYFGPPPRAVNLVKENSYA
jgi:hypothetical protein